jgi:D-alanyl-D-alanine carboxypeptidase
MAATTRNYSFSILFYVAAFLTSLFSSPLNCAYGQDADNVQPVHKKHKSHLKHHRKSAHVASRIHLASLVIDADNGKVLQTENADVLHYPASLTKMMTLYLTFEALKKGTLTLNQSLPISEHAANQPQTNIALSEGEAIPVKDAILSIVVHSANDSAVVLGEALGGTESEFAEKMTRKAAVLGMKSTVFRNASGLPDPRQHTTARDMATLGLALKRDFPQYFPFFKAESFSYSGRTYVSHNHVMMRYDGVDGIKTGYIRAAGFNLVTSANHDGHHLVAVVLGGRTWRARDDKMIALLDRTFTQLAALPGSNRVALAASVKNRKLAAVSYKQPESEEEGEGDLRIEQ